ncbi:MAG: ketoacyl-ACP synthase III [Chloroflexi bacterium]|nr:ketoacyl-ACP synthase III [Chloroflexota bacterium]MBI3740205.1 ketoacyl-ACP synthase III [Chloroflexota bacterium]
MTRYAHITGWGCYVPSRVVTNDELAKIVDTSDGWIRERTGIAERHISSAKESTGFMAIHAARQAIETADLDPTRIDLVIVATATPEYMFPSTASLVQDAVGATHAGGFDLAAGCSGFGYALATAASMIKSGMHNKILVVGSETLSRLLDWEDRATCVLFGDGAGAVMLEGKDEPGGVLATVLGSDGSGGELLIIPGGGSKHPSSPETLANKMHFVKMNGREVYRFATRVMAQAARQVVQQAGWRFENIDLLIPHQANVRIIDSAAKALKLSPDKVFVNLDRYGNTSSASIPIALCEAINADKVKPGDHIVFVAFGAGLSWAACAVQWSAPKRRVPRPKIAVSLLRFGWFGLRSLLARLLRKIDAWLSRIIDWIEQRPTDE